MNTTAFHHALQVNEDICYGCSHCMSVCPTEAIRVRNGKASIYEHRCIDCGECFKVCPTHAIFVEQDDFNTIFNYKYRIALVPAILLGQFPFDVTPEKLKGAIIETGFTHVFESGICVELNLELTEEYMDRNQDTRPMISPFCPAVLRLIQVKFPSLVENIVRIKPPLDLAATYFKKRLIDSGIDEKEIGIFYITPCAAKITAIKSPVGETVSSIDGVINMNFLYSKLYKILKKSNPTDKSQHGKLTKKGVLWSLTNGEADHLPSRSLAIDEIHNVMEFLEQMENGEIKDVDFLELRACDQSCAGGILTVKNRFLTVEKLKKISTDYPEKRYEPTRIDEYREYMVQHSFLNEIKARPMLMLDEDMQKAMAKMEKVNKVMCYLPGFDCGACGAPNCQALAEDIAQKEANISNCVFMQMMMEKHKKLSTEHAFEIIEKIWGKNRLEKNCNKSLSKNESE